MSNTTPSSTRLDYALANMLNGTHTIQGEREARVVQLAELMTLHNAVDQCGWHRHTSDWDWFIEIDGNEDGLSVRFKDYDLVNGCACVDHAKLTHIVMETNDGEVEYEIDKLTTIRWEWA